MTPLFLWCSLFLPRTTMTICWLFAMLPTNNTPFWLDVFAWFFAPRLLIAWWAYELDMHPLVVGIFILGELYTRLWAANTNFKTNKKEN